MRQQVVSEVAKSVNNIALRDVTVIDGGTGQGIAGAAMGRAKAMAETLAALDSILGIDLRKLSRDIAGNLASDGAGDGKIPSGPTN